MGYSSYPNVWRYTRTAFSSLHYYVRVVSCEGSLAAELKLCAKVNSRTSSLWGKNEDLDGTLARRLSWQNGLRLSRTYVYYPLFRGIDLAVLPSSVCIKAHSPGLTLCTGGLHWGQAASLVAKLLVQVPWTRECILCFSDKEVLSGEIFHRPYSTVVDLYPGCPASQLSLWQSPDRISSIHTTPPASSSFFSNSL